MVIGVDSSESMIKRAQQQYPDIKFIVSDALALPFEEQFDVVFSNAVFHWITDHNALLNNIHKVLKPGGCLLYVGDGGSNELEAAQRLGMQVVQAVWYLKEGINQPAQRKTDFEHIEKPMDIIELIKKLRIIFTFT